MVPEMACVPELMPKMLCAILCEKKLGCSNFGTSLPEMFLRFFFLKNELRESCLSNSLSKNGRHFDILGDRVSISEHFWAAIQKWTPSFQKPGGLEQKSSLRSGADGKLSPKVTWAVGVN